MAERPRFFDDIAGVAGGALSALAGIREEAEAMIRARVDETIRKLDLVRRSDMDAVQELAANARAGQEAAEARVDVRCERCNDVHGSGLWGEPWRAPPIPVSPVRRARDLRRPRPRSPWP